ncbi:hypothetical protein MAL08_02530 [Leptospira noguchii]|uniref:hypothetical protein n=1 Tax=Leptospira noguchii TaxID=28182 RepID=UPI001FB7DDF2|nr:hypothetical protein [Leptospira noguchii]UOG38246.1 hypothetical protein MAL08_02530 [Leptospira noguchii]
MERKRTTQRLASMVARRVVSHFNYEICERFAPIFLRRTHVRLVLLESYRNTK